MMNAGELRTPIIIQKKGDGEPDENGYPNFETVDVYRLKAKVKTISGKEYSSADREVTSITNKFIIHKRKLDKKTMFIRYNDKEFNIINIHEIYNNRFLEVTATSLD